MGGLQDVSPRIHVTDADFDGLTRGGALCAPGGRLGPAEFEALMREQLQRHTQAPPPPHPTPREKKLHAAAGPSLPTTAKAYETPAAITPAVMRPRPQSPRP